MAGSPQRQGRATRPTATDWRLAWSSRLKQAWLGSYCPMSVPRGEACGRWPGGLHVTLLPCLLICLPLWLVAVLFLFLPSPPPPSLFPFFLTANCLFILLWVSLTGVALFASSMAVEVDSRHEAPSSLAPLLTPQSPLVSALLRTCHLPDLASVPLCMLLTGFL